MKQSQKAGEGSTQIQVENLVVGIDEKRAREIYDEKYIIAKRDLTKEALNIADARAKELENRLIPKMKMIDEKLSILADPSFQLLLVEAQKAAAATERIPDYDLLSELLINRIQNGKDRKIRAGIKRAIEIVEDISDDALQGLTVAHSVTKFFPVSGKICEGLDVLNNLFGKIIYSQLPLGSEWLEHLYILDAVRIGSFGNMKKIHEYYPEELAEYVTVGIKKNTENYYKAVAMLSNVGLKDCILVDHELNPDFVRIPITNKEYIPLLALTKEESEQVINQPLSAFQKDVVTSVYQLYQEDPSVREQNIQKFMEEWDKRSNLKMLREWWDSLPVMFDITSVGKVLAHANAQRCDDTLPSLN